MSYRTAFITGASSGIGRGLAKRLALTGTEVAVAARRAEALDELVDEIRGLGGKARAYPLDVSNASLLGEVLTRADDDLGGIELVVANAGMGRSRWSGKLRYGDCQDVIAVNVAGAVATLVALIPRMLERQQGHLVGISSLAGYLGLPRNATYCASKAFLQTFLEGLRVDLHKTPLVVTDVQPGFVRTPMTENNDLPMPFMLELDEAVDIILNGIADHKPVVAFPWQLATLVRSARLVPKVMYDQAIARSSR